LVGIKNAIEVGDIQAFIQYIRSFTQPIAQIANISNILNKLLLAQKEYLKFLEEEEEVSDNPQPVKIEDIKGMWSLEMFVLDIDLIKWYK
jgi:hypothetical protein